MFAANRFPAQILLTLLLCYVAAPAWVLALKVEQSGNANSQTELKQLLQLYEGEFDNFQQVANDGARPRAHIHLNIERVNAAALGEQVFFVRAQRAGQPSLRRLDSFRLNSAQQIEMLSYALTSDEQWLAAERDPTLWAITKLEQFRLLAGCLTFWQRTGDRFIGACVIVNGEQSGALTIMEQDELRLPELAGDGLDGRFRRCVFYDGEVTYISETGKKQKPFAITLHNQGQIVPLAGSKYAVQMTEMIDKQGKPALKVALLEDGKELVAAPAKSSDVRFRFITEVVEVRLTKQKRP